MFGQLIFVHLFSGKDLLIASASGDSTVKIWTVGLNIQDEDVDADPCQQTIPIKGNGYAMDLKLGLFDGKIPVLFLALDDSKLHIYGVDENDGKEFRVAHR